MLLLKDKCIWKNFWKEYKIWEMAKNIHKSLTTKFEFNSFKIGDRSTIRKTIITYSLSSLSVNASSVSSVSNYLRKLGRSIKNLDCYLLLFTPISEWRFHLIQKSVNETFKFSPLKTNKTLKIYISRNWQSLLILYHKLSMLTSFL